MRVLAHGRSVYARAGLDLYVIFNDHPAGLHDLLVAAVWPTGEAEPVRAYSDPLVQSHPVANAGAVANSHATVGSELVANPTAFFDDCMRMEHGSGPDLYIAFDYHIGADRCSGADSDGRVNHCCRVDRRFGRLRRMEEF